MNYFQKNKLTTIIDLRTKEEISKKANYFQDKGFDYYNITLKGENCPKREKDIPFGYMEIINDKDNIKLDNNQNIYTYETKNTKEFNYNFQNNKNSKNSNQTSNKNSKNSK